MTRMRLPVVIGPAGLQAAAPTHQVVPGSFLPVVPGKSDANGVLLGVALGEPALNGATLLVDVPDEDCTGNALDTVKIKQRYAGHWLVAGHVIPGT